MFRALWRLFGGTEDLKVDYSKEPILPNGAASIGRHRPASEGMRTIKPGDLTLIEFQPFETYAGFYEQHSNENLADAVILDAFWKILLKTQSAKVAERYFGRFSGQIFFLGTEFVSHDGVRCVPFLNLRTHVMGNGRFLCPSDHIINHDVMCCACVLGGADMYRRVSKK